MAKHTTRARALPVDPPVPATLITTRFAAIVAPEQAALPDTYAMPEGFEADAPDVLFLTGNLCPVAVFEEPGDYLRGRYRGFKDEVGPNKSRLYTFDVLLPDTGEVIETALWGCTILDIRFDVALTQVNAARSVKGLPPLPAVPTGTDTLVLYRGDVPTARGDNDAHDWLVAFKGLLS